MKVLFVILAVACLGFGQSKLNVTQTGVIDASGLTSYKPPLKTVSTLPTASSNTNVVFVVTDGTSASDCTGGGGSTRSLCISNGTSWAALGGGGGGGGSITNPFTSGAGTSTAYLASGMMPCVNGSVSLSAGTFTYPGGTVAASATTSQEFVIQTGLTGLIEYASVQISEHTQFTQGASVTNLAASLGRPGSSTNDELLEQTQLMQSSGDAWYAYQRPQPPILGGSNAYTLVLALRTVGGNVSNLTSGQVNYKVCGWLNQ